MTLLTRSRCALGKMWAACNDAQSVGLKGVSPVIRHLWSLARTRLANVELVVLDDADELVLSVRR